MDTAALLSLQLGWGLWLMPSDYARLGWCANVVLVVLAALTAYSGTLFTRLYQAVPSTVLFSDVGAAAAGRWGRGLVSLIIYSLDATRCVILHLAAAQSLRHVFPPGPDQPPLWQCGAAVLVLAGILVQVRGLAEMSSVFMAGTASQLVAVGIVVWELISHPEPEARTEWISQDDPLTSRVAAVVALMNMIFAFGGQFAFTELLGTMRQPAHFPRAILP
ncbi:Aa_trans domain-containing protein [Haematococcus lacustris]|uniref:Aa_trans domain-containing protein n=1 Tax=Haematococcus lacustris TaxID=44745 RepID=A0A699ZKF7_HAELA|nr:Aa_trans domain-containing protein [Haematococcus lacustris]